MTHLTSEVECLPPIDELLLAPHEAVTFVPGGHSSNVHHSGAYILKLTKFMGDPEAAVTRAHMLRWEHEYFEEYLGEYVPPTLISIVPADETGDLARVLTLQRVAPGVPIGEALRDPAIYRTDIIRFLERALKMYRLTGMMADVAHLEHGFRFSRTPNLIVDPKSHHPTLVDTNRGRIQRRPYAGEVLSLAIATGAKAALIRLKREEIIKHPTQSW